MQATEKLYDKDSYLKEFQATVVSCEQKDETTWKVVLDKTAFFPEGGGQTGDIGWLNEVEVTDTREKSGVIYHETKTPMEVGTQVAGTIDFAVRFDKMQQHTGEHILSGIVCAAYGYNNVGFHLSKDITTLDFDGELSLEQVRELEINVNQAIHASFPVQVKFPAKDELAEMEYRSKIEIEGQVRIVEIPGIDRCACCAPHVKTTAEVGLLKIQSCERHRGGCRLTIVCGMRALRDYQQKQESVGKVSASLSAKPEKIAEAVIHLQEQQAKLREQLNSIQAMYLKGKLEMLTGREKSVCIFEESLDSIAMRNFVNDAMEKCSGVCGAFIGTDDGGYHYVLGSKTVDMRDFSKKLNEKFHGKGGGKPQMVQGSLGGNAKEIQEFISQSGVHMTYKEFQNLKLSALGMGCLRLPVKGSQGDIDVEATKKMVDYAFEKGINYYDTAWGYHDGKSETVLGEILKEYPRDSFYLATKFPGYDAANMNKVEAIFEEQLKKCQVEYFDFYLFHNVCESNIDAYLNPEFGILQYLLEQKKNGRIRHLGFSTHGTLDTVKRFLDAYGKYMEFCQIQLNWMDWKLQNAKEKVELLEKYHLPIWVMEPVRGGKLANIEAEYEAQLKKIRPNATTVEWAFRFLQSIPAVTMTLSGMSNLEQLKENVAIYETEAPLNEHEIKKLFEVGEAMTAKITLPCTGCSYCTSHCPMELGIPELIELYNEHVYTGDGYIAPVVIGAFPDEKKPSACLGCRACEDVCPQNIKISEMMRDFVERLKE